MKRNLLIVLVLVLLLSTPACLRRRDRATPTLPPGNPTTAPTTPPVAPTAPQAGPTTVPTAPPAEPPGAPIDCRAEALSQTEIAIYWQFNPSPIQLDGFRIYQGATSLEAQAAAGQTSAVISNLDAGVQYHFDVRAYNAAGESPADACFVDVTTLP